MSEDAADPAAAEVQAATGQRRDSETVRVALPAVQTEDSLSSDPRSPGQSPLQPERSAGHSDDLDETNLLAGSVVNHLIKETIDQVSPLGHVADFREVHPDLPKSPMSDAYSQSSRFGGQAADTQNRSALRTSPSGGKMGSEGQAMTIPKWMLNPALGGFNPLPERSALRTSQGRRTSRHSDKKDGVVEMAQAVAMAKNELMFVTRNALPGKKLEPLHTLHSIRFQTVLASPGGKAAVPTQRVGAKRKVRALAPLKKRTATTPAPLDTSHEPSLTVSREVSTELSKENSRPTSRLSRESSYIDRGSELPMLRRDFNPFGNTNLSGGEDQQKADRTEIKYQRPGTRSTLSRTSSRSNRGVALSSELPTSVTGRSTRMAELLGEETRRREMLQEQYSKPPARSFTPEVEPYLAFLKEKREARAMQADTAADSSLDEEKQVHNGFSLELGIEERTPIVEQGAREGEGVHLEKQQGWDL